MVMVLVWTWVGKVRIRNVILCKRDMDFFFFPSIILWPLVFIPRIYVGSRSQGWESLHYGNLLILLKLEYKWNRKYCPTHLISYLLNEPSGIVKHLSMRHRSLYTLLPSRKQTNRGLNKQKKKSLYLHNLKALRWWLLQAKHSYNYIANLKQIYIIVLII